MERIFCSRAVLVFKRMNRAFFGLLIFAIGPALPAQTLDTGWQLKTACALAESGAQISQSTYAANGWLATAVPSTVIAAQLAAGVFDPIKPAGQPGSHFDPYWGMNLRLMPGTTYPIGTFFSNQEVPADSPYKCGWWYRTRFNVATGGGRRWLQFAGINYRGAVWVNGHQIAGPDEVAGAYRRYEFDVTDVTTAGPDNVVAVETFAPGAKDLGINWVDWNPCPADKNMGLWGEVTLRSSGAVIVRAPQVETHFTADNLRAADLTIRALLTNATGTSVSGVLRAQLQGLALPVQLALPVTLAAHEAREVEMTPLQFAALHVSKAEVWWPYGLGGQHLNTLRLAFTTDDGEVSDTSQTRFGVREMSSELDTHGHRLFRVNRHPILIRGGGWSPDMLLRESPKRMTQQFKLVRDLGLNTVRLEGKLETEQFFNLADEQGVLVMAGWCCCDHWEHWKDWTAQDLAIATRSLRAQMLRLRGHASMLVWLNGSDGPPPASVEQAYLDVERETHWPNAVLSSAAANATVPTGKSGVKMLGPYDYVVPSYWLRDVAKAGGAYGFNTETSPGPAIPDASELARFLPGNKLWPMNSTWDYHTGGGKYKSLSVMDRAMDNIYGKPSSVDEYVHTAEAMAYDAERAMFEAYGRNKYVSTGVVQWMLNNAWPSLIWHLYDYNLQPGAGYYGTKKANEPIHAQFSYDDHSAVVVNSRFSAVNGLRLTALVYSPEGKVLYRAAQPVRVAADGVARVLQIPQGPLQGNLRMVRLVLRNASGETVSHNDYWLSGKETRLDWSRTDYTHTEPFEFEDLSGLRKLPAATVVAKRLPDASGSIRVLVTNTGNGIASQLQLLTERSDGQPYDAVLWSDSFLQLMPGERVVLTGRPLDPSTAVDVASIKVVGWNVAPVKSERR